MIDRNDDATTALIARIDDAFARGASSFEAHRAIAPLVGAHLSDGLAEVVFWTPELLEQRIPAGDVYLECLEPPEDLDLSHASQRLDFAVTRVPMERTDAFSAVAVSGMTAGHRDRIGTFYRLAWQDGEGDWHHILDPMAWSLPFGAFAPAEFYDAERLLNDRADRDYWQQFAGDAPHKFGPPVNIQQIHVPTATWGGTLAALTQTYERLAERVRAGADLEPQERLFAGYDAVQLLPVEPTTVYEAGPSFWQEEAGERRITVDLKRPDTTNWGYDVVIAGMGTVNPVLLESGRPEELVDFAAALHNFPRPKKLILDVVFGHSDNQGTDVLNSYWFAGPNMYGQNMNYRHPAVRALMLEMQRRKVNFGADGVRVDGAQDFKWWDAEAETLRHDDEYLQSMSDIVQEVAGTRYRPWFVFEDGRPWPQEDWELSSTYRAVIENQHDSDVFQWGPLTFAHNTPFLYGFWLSKWWRIREILNHGSNWISGCANHDTLRRGTQVDTKLNVNTRLGGTRMEILDKAYDNPAIQMVTYAAFPGVPMDFLNASARASWGFIRNQDDKYGVKVVAEEAISLKWQVDEYSYSLPQSFPRLKALGFETREQLARFMEFLPALVEVTDYDLNVIAKLLNEVDPTLDGPHPVTVDGLKEIARAWMDDMHDYCNVGRHHSVLSGAQTKFNHQLREFRRARPWLRDNLGDRDRFDYRRPVEGTVLFTSLRYGPDGEQVYMIAHMEGGHTGDFDPLRLPIEGLEGFGWEVALRTPPIGGDFIGGPIDLHDSMGIVYVRKPG
ncbi:glucosylglycerol hydrolase [Roseobacter sp. HKCCA0434]|uniref:glucosylglycerol hydrolase n=1 Tax=Roseobacter sp. HKCCA0434 TaxID=3079297 RepID=UPI0029059798|nr:glucosylglycerol hydrolase [Roseobacter sp. HKCCA0434]